MIPDASASQLKKRNVTSSASEELDVAEQLLGYAAGIQQQQQNIQQKHRDQGIAEMTSKIPPEDHPLMHSPYFAQACTSEVLLPSATAWRVLVGGPLVLWFLCTVTGIIQYSGLPTHKSNIQHSMQWFDALFRAAGPLLPLLPFLLRCCATEFPRFRRIMSWQANAEASAPRRGLAPPAPAPLQGTLPWACLLLYFLVGTVRILLYLTHLWSQRVAQDTSPLGAGRAGPVGANPDDPAAMDLVPAQHIPGWVSDHVVLGASVVACLQLELVCSVSDVVKLQVVGAGLLREFAAASSLIGSMVLTVFVCVDMYFTCRFYHYPAESAAALLVGLLLFQVPLIAWLYRRSIKPSS